MAATQIVDDASIDALRFNFRGDLIRPGEPDYEEQRRVFNGLIDKRPALIARCTGTADVAAAVNFARDRGLLVAVRGGGHSVAGFSTCDDGIVIDLSRMRGVRVDPATGTALAQGGAAWGDFDRETQVVGLATAGGLGSSTGSGGRAYPAEPTMPIFPPELLGKKMVAFLGAWPGPAEEAEKAFQPLRNFGQPAFELVLPMPYTMVQQIQDEDAPFGSYWYWKSAYVK